MKKLLIFLAFGLVLGSCRNPLIPRKSKCDRKVEKLKVKCPLLFISVNDTIRDTVVIESVRIDTVHDYREHYDTNSLDSVLYAFLLANNVKIEKETIYKFRDLACEECLKAIFIGDGLITKSQGVTSKVYFKDGNIINEITVDEIIVTTEKIVKTEKIIERSFYDDFKTNIIWFVLILAVAYLFIKLKTIKNESKD